jgi:hypothetical protein
VQARFDQIPIFPLLAPAFDLEPPSGAMYFLDFAVRRRTRSVDRYDEILKEATAAKKTRYRESVRESRHGLEKLAEHDDLDLVKIHWGLRTANHSAKVVFDTILHATDAQ